MYIYNLPYDPRQKLCSILDQNNTWEKLAGRHMKFDTSTISDLRNEVLWKKSPSNELLYIWGNQNHTVLELFLLLSEMKNYQAMLILKEHVDAKYHCLIEDGDENLNRLLHELILQKRIKCDPKVPVHNFNMDSEKILNVEKVAVFSRESNESFTPLVADQRYLKPPRSPIAPASRALTPSDLSSCVAESAGLVPQILYEELKKSTKDWDPAMILGRGGFGTVFKGTWKCTHVAIKKLEQRQNNPDSNSEQIKQSVTELHCLNAYRHDNVLPLYGYSIGGPEPCLVYQYMSGGCLDMRLRVKDDAKVLKWDTRINIAIGTARGLQFLHTIGEKPLIHGDIKSANILLDPNDIPRIGDFGLAREGPQDHPYMKVSRIHGTRPYLPSEFLREKKFSTKVDTYSFGIVLFEIATGLGPYSERRKKKFLRDHVMDYEEDLMGLKDARAPHGEQIYTGLINIGRLCVQEKAKTRPEMVSVLIQLEKV